MFKRGGKGRQARDHIKAPSAEKFRPFWSCDPFLENRVLLGKMGLERKFDLQPRQQAAEYTRTADEDRGALNSNFCKGSSSSSKKAR
nr:hypothetical protein CFP56_08160 [Quercus suber]